MNTPETSVIIRTFNEEKYLPGLLKGLGEQTYQNFEVVVIDSGSLDRTREIASTADKLLRIDSQDFTFGYSLNVGIEAASGEYAVIVSAHMLPATPDWLELLIRPMQDRDVAMVYGRQLGWSTSKHSETLDLGRTFGTRKIVQTAPDYFAHNANSVVRRDLWLKHRFDEILPGLEDIEWAKYWMDQGFKVVYEPQAALHHIHEESWRQIKRRYYRESIASGWIGVKGKRHLVIDSLKDIGCFFADIAILGFKPTRSMKREGFFSMSKEVMLFRWNKCIGSFAGIIEGTKPKASIVKNELFFNRSTKSVVVKSPGRSSIEDHDIPEMKPGDVLVRTAYIGVNGTDVAIYDGTFDQSLDESHRYPVVPGQEMTGRIVTFGSNVTHLSEGQPVIIQGVQTCGTCFYCLNSNLAACERRLELGTKDMPGMYTQSMVVPGRLVHPLPEDADLKKSVICHPLSVVLKGIDRLTQNWYPSSNPKRCAVLGAGSIGHLCAQILALRGHHVTAFDQEALRRSYFKDIGIEVSDDLDQITDYEVLVEMTGDASILNYILERCSPGATVLLLGLPYAHQSFTLGSMVAYDKTIVGSVGSDAYHYRKAISLLPELQLDEYTNCILPFDQYITAWEMFKQRKHLKILIQASP